MSAAILIAAAFAAFPGAVALVMVWRQSMANERRITRLEAAIAFMERRSSGRKEE